MYFLIFVKYWGLLGVRWYNVSFWEQNDWVGDLKKVVLPWSMKVWNHGKEKMIDLGFDNFCWRFCKRRIALHWFIGFFYFPPFVEWSNLIIRQCAVCTKQNPLSCTSVFVCKNLFYQSHWVMIIFDKNKVHDLWL